MNLRHYLLTLPERFVRSVLGLGAGVAREVGEVVIPESVRRGQLYQNVVDATLRFLTERVGGVVPMDPGADALPEQFLARRTVGNAIDVLGFVAFHASPMWLLATLSDVCGAGRQLVPEIATALRAHGLLSEDARFESVDQLLNGLERASAQMAATLNTPPLDVEGLRREWATLQTEARSIPRARLPSREALGQVWTALKTEAARQNRSVFETSSLLALSAVQKLPEKVQWFSEAAGVGATRTGQLLATMLVTHYRETLGEMRRVGHVQFGKTQLGPYYRAAVGQYSPHHRTLTQQLIDRVQGRGTSGKPQ
jgi:hypothetical protein